MRKRKSGTTIKYWDPADRPREKLQVYGPSLLSNTELLAVLLRTGTKEKSAISLSREVLNYCDNDLNELAKKGIPQLMQIRGMGLAKAVTIMAAIELSRRRDAPFPIHKGAISSSQLVINYLKTHLKDKGSEVFGVLYLNQANRVKKFEVISTGGISGTVADIRIILRKALENEAVGLILCHNHPSGNLSPSPEDKNLTTKMVQAARYHSIQVLDHIIVGDSGYYSFADNGEIT